MSGGGWRDTGAAALAALDRLVRPRPAVAVVVLVGALALWPLADLEPGAVAAAIRADAALVSAFADGDADAIAAAGRDRLALPVAGRDAFDMGRIADALFRSGAIGEALAVAERALESARRHEGEGSLAAAMAANNLAWFLVSLDHPRAAALDRARDLAEGAVRSAPDNPFFLGTLGTVLLRQGDPAAARERLEAAIAGHDPAALSATDRAILALALARQGDAAAAQAALDAARAVGEPDPLWLRKAEAAVAAITPTDGAAPR